LTTLSLQFHSSRGAETRSVEIHRLIIAGWTGRDREAVEKHIRELEDVGVRRPISVPVFYRVSATRLTTVDEIEAVGASSSGEVEFILRDNGALWVGVGSDHTDRDAETYNVTVSKQMCDKPIAMDFWAFDEVIEHWDRLMLRSRIDEKGDSTIYQEGSVAAMLDPQVLMSGASGGAGLAEGTMMFCGTLAAKGGIRPSHRFDFEIEDPVLKRKISHGYGIKTLLNMG
jgi:hypothetical protein